MYIQNNPQGSLPFSLPKGYRGSAFDIPQGEPPETEQAPDPPVLTEAEPQENEPKTAATENGDTEGEKTTAEDEKDAAPAFSEHKDHHGSGLFSKIPFLSSLLPPPRRGRGEKGALPEWVILGIVLFLLLDTPENDLLPFLLILLLWD